MLSIKKSQKIAKEYYCELCHYMTYNYYDFKKHNNTKKHLINDKSINSIILSEKSQEKQFICINCNKSYRDNSGLWRHKQKCTIGQILNTNNDNENIENCNNQISTELIMNIMQQNKELQMLLIEQHKQNNELQNKVLELCKNGTHNITNTNSNNKTFNLQFFLNETCKDAMNIMDFVDSIKLQLSDLEKLGKNGFVEGISNIIIKNLNSLDETKRPVHCTDSKREVMYVKDENKWEKENDTKMKLRNAIKKVAHKNTMLLNEFRNKHPDCLKSESKVSDQYNKLVFEAMGGKGDNDSEKEDKIIKNIAKEVTIDKVL
jgi:hypothetical protein